MISAKLSVNGIISRMSVWVFQDLLEINVIDMPFRFFPS